MIKFHSVYLRFVVYFLLFGFIVSGVTSFVNLNLQYRSLDQEILGSAQGASENIKNMVESEIKHLDNDLQALIRNPSFINYLQSREGGQRAHAEHLLLSHLEANESYFQLRYIDETGIERIRVERARHSLQGQLVDVAQLQNKSKRYYFREVIGLSGRQIWRSNLDLNIEHGKIEQPLRPTLRVAAPVFHNGAIAGMIIINTEMSRLLDRIRQNADFEVYLVDGDGYVMLHPDPAQDWARYQQGPTIMSVWPQTATKLMAASDFHTENLYAFSLEEQFGNGEGIRLVLETNNDYIRALTRHNRQVAVYLAAIILAIALPVGMFLAVWPARIQRQLRLAMHKNKEQLEIIDQYVLYTETDSEGTITEASTAMCHLSGYSRQELVGQTHALLSSGETKPETYKDLWDTIGRGAVWRGEFQDKRSDGSPFWVDTTIQPRRSHGITEGYTAISVDITDKKRIARISEEDFLTGIANRVKLDQVIQQELERARRYSTPFAVIMIDADHFKAVNDQYGHGVGDEVLKNIAKILKTQTRKLDLVGRWGGEEFLVLCSDTTVDGALELAEKLRRAIEVFDFSPVPKQTASFGVAAFIANDDAKSLVERADEALYQAKEQGRNQVAQKSP